MQYILERYFRELSKKMNAEQAFSILLILAFSEYHQCRAGKQKTTGAAGQKVGRSYFMEVFSDIYDDMFWEAFWRFSSMTDWQFVEESEEIQKSLLSIRRELASYFEAGLWRGKESDLTKGLDDVLEMIWEQRERSGNYTATPASIQRLLIELLGDYQINNMTELCCGTAMSGILLWKRLARYNARLDFCGVDFDSMLCSIARLNLYFHGIYHGKIEQKDLLAKPETSFEKSSDLIIMDIPRGSNGMEAYDPGDFRLEQHNRKMIYSDWIFLQDALHRLSPNGIAAALVTTGVLIRMNEKSLREQLIRNDWLEAVITLPVNLYSNTRIGTELLIFNKAKEYERQGKILFVDISDYAYRAQRNANAITEEGIEIAVKCFCRWKEIAGISKIQNIAGLDREMCSFKPMQYIRYSKAEAVHSQTMLQDIALIVRGAQVTKSEADSADHEKTAYFINIKDIQDDRICFETAERIHNDHPAWKEKFQIEEDDLLITSKGTAIKMAIVETKPPLAFFSGNLTLLRVNKKKYHPYILYEYLNSEQGRRALEQIQSGTTIRILNNTSLKNLKLPEFELEQMQLIGAKLKEEREKFFREQKRIRDAYHSERKKLVKGLKEG